MEIHEYYYNDINKILYVEFSTVDDEDKFYRILEISYSDIEYYSPNLITEEDLLELDIDLVMDLLAEYLKENDLPEEISL